MRTIILTLILLVPLAFSQIYDSGVIIETDEFTGSKSCMQLVLGLNNDQGITLIIDDEGFKFVYIWRDYGSSGENRLAGYGDETIYIRIGEEVREYDVEWANDEYTDDYEIGATTFPESQIEWLLASPVDVRVRFAGQYGNADFTINHEIITTLAAGFGQECLNGF